MIPTYSFELALVLISIASIVGLILWYSFRAESPVRINYELLEAKYPPESFPCFGCHLTDVCSKAYDMDIHNDNCVFLCA